MQKRGSSHAARLQRLNNQEKKNIFKISDFSPADVLKEAKMLTLL